MPVGCAVPMRRSRAPSRTGSGPAACDVSGVLCVNRGVGVSVSHPAGVSRGADTIPLPTLVSQLGSVHWRVDYTLSSSELQEVNEPVVHLTFNVRDRECEKMTAVPVTVSANKFRVLLAGEAPGTSVRDSAGGDAVGGMLGRGRWKGCCNTSSSPTSPSSLCRAEAGPDPDEHPSLRSQKRATAGGCDTELGAHTGAPGWGGERFPALRVSGGPLGSSNKVPVTKLSRVPLYPRAVRRFPAAAPPRQDSNLRYHRAANGSALRPPRSQWGRAVPTGGGGGGGGFGLRCAVAAMPECPELHLAARFINGACGGLVFAGGVERSAVGRGPEVPFRSEAYRISAIARGKELRLTLSALDPAAPAATPPQDLVIRFGMSGSFRLCPAAELPRHAHLRFLTRESPPRALCFVDPRRFGSWRLGDAWQPERGPCVVSEYQAFR